MPQNSHTLRATHLILTLAALLSVPSAQAVLKVSNPVTGNWSAGTSWVGGVAPVLGDTVEIVSGAVITTSTSASVAGVKVDAGGTLVLNSALTLTHGTTPDMDVFGTVSVIGGSSALTLGPNATVVVESGGVISHNGSSSGFVSAGAGSSITFSSGGKFTLPKNGGTIPTAIWLAGSLCEITGFTSATSGPGGMGQSFANFVWNCTAQSVTCNLTLGGLGASFINFTVLSTGTGILRMAGSGGLTLNISGNLSLSAGTLQGTGTAATPVNVTVGGDIVISGGTLDLRGASGTGATGTTITLPNGNFSVTTPGIVTLSGSGGGIVNFTKPGTQTLTQSGTILGQAIVWSVSSVTILQLNSPVTMSGTMSVDGILELNGNGGAFSALSGTTGVVRNNGTAAPLTLGGATGTGDYSGQLVNGAGGFTITKTGNGIATLRTSSPAYTGKITILSNRVDILSDGCLGAVPGSPINDSITLNGGSLSTSNNFTLSANRGIVIGPNGGTISPAQNPSDLSSYVLTYNGIISGSSGGAFKHGRNGVLIIGGANTYDGPTWVLSGGTPTLGTLQLGASGVIPDGSAVGVTNATLDLAGFSETIGSLGSDAPSIIKLGAGTLTCGGNGNNTTVLGPIIGAGGSLAKVGSGTLTLSSGGNTYSGGTTVSGGGTLSVLSSSSVGTGNATVSGGGTLTLAGSGNIAPAATLNINGASTVNLNYAGTMPINALYFNGVLQAGGTWGAPASGAANTDSRFTGTGILNIPFYIVLTCSPNITVSATSAAGAVVTYSSSATGNCPPINVNCTPPSGSTFPIGTTLVTCTATDSCGTVTNCSFQVTVNSDPAGKEYFSKDNSLPPTNTVYISPDDWHVLFAMGIVIKDASHDQFTASHPPPGLGTTIFHVFNSGVGFDISTDNGATYTHATATANAQVQVTHTFDAGGIEHYDNEMQGLDFTVPSGLGPVMLRESPTLQSTGKTTIRAVAGGNLIASTFDLWLEASTDGGATWQPASGPAHVEMRNDPNAAPEVAEGTTLLPPPQDKYVSPEQWHALYAMGIVIKDVSHDFFTQGIIPPTGSNSTSESFNSRVDLKLSTDGGLTYQDVSASAPVNVNVKAVGSPSSGRLDTEMTGLSLSGLPGGLMIRESPTLPSRGGTKLDPQADGTYKMHSFFDIFPEISTDGGATWSPATNGAVRMNLTKRTPEVPKPTPNLPPLDGNYVSPADWHAFYAMGIVISNVSHARFTQTQPPPPAGGSNNETFGSEVKGQISSDGGATFQSFTAPAAVAVTVASTTLDSGSTRVFNTEMTQLDISGGTLPGAVMIRESPSKASLGRTSIRNAGPGDFRLESFFDIFTEISMDGGATWLPQVSKPVQMFLTTNAPGVPPIVLNCSTDITVVATSPAGAVVTYVSSATGGCPPVTVVCNPPSGSTFPIGTTTVSCTASDGCGQTTNCSFSIHVKLPPPDYFFPQPLLPPPGSVYISPALWHVLYSSGIIIRDVRHRFFTQNYPLPPLGTSQLETFNSQLDYEISTDNGATFSPGTGTAQVSVQVTHTSDDSNGSHFDTEMLQLDLLGSGFHLRESPTLQSKGQTTVRQVNGGFMIDSFFDVFTEISTDGGVSWLPAQDAGHVELRPDPAEVDPVGHPTDLLPPPNGGYVSPQLWHALYAQGIVIKDVSHKFFTDSHQPPAPGNTDTHPFGSILDLSVSTDGGSTYQSVRANCDVTVSVTGQGSGASGFYDTEMLQLDATVSVGALVLKIRESPTLPSRGGTEIKAQPDGSRRIGSFFDIFTELSTDGGVSWSGATNGPVRMELSPIALEVPKPTPNLPPLDGTYISPAKWHALYASGIIITNASHDRFLQNQPPPPPGGSQNENFGSRIRGLISMNGGATFQPFSANAGVQVQVTSHSSLDTPSTRFFDTEMLSLNLQGGTLPAGVMVRESPSKASLGRTSVRDTGGGVTYMIDSFFDVFTELSLDGGATWSPSVTAPGTMGLTTNPPASTLAITCPPDITVYADTAAGAVVTFTVTTTGGCPPINLVVNPPSGSTFPIGTTTVTATATDACGGNVQCQFLVHVNPPPPEYFFPQPVLPPIGSVYISPALYHLLFNNGIVIRDVRHRFFTQHFPLPPLGASQTEIFSSELDFDVSMDNGATFTPAHATVNVTVQVTHSHDVGGTQVFDTEMLQLDLTGGPIYLRESPTLQSTGKTTVRQVQGGYLISSFFDVNTEVSTDGGQSWTPAQQPGHVECHPDPAQVTPVPEPTPLLPPPNGSYVSPQLWHALYAQGIVIRDVRHKIFTGSLPPPPPGITNFHTFDSQLDMQISTDGGSTYQYVRVAAPVQVSVASHGSATDTIYDTEMLSLSLSGLPAGVMIRESPSLPSRGQTQIDQQSDGTYRIGSFFDIFTELSLDGGATWSGATNGPVRVVLTTSSVEVPKPNPNLPPLDGTYISPAMWHALYANGIIITNASHDRFTQTQPPPPPGGSQTENFGSRVRGQISMNGGASFQPFSANAGVQVQVTSSLDSGPTRFFNTEMLSLNLQGGTLPAGVMVRESPSKASLGRTSVRTTASGYMIDSFFDVFTEVSLDGGATWSPGLTHAGTMGLTTNPPASTLAITCPADITVYATTAAGAVVNFTVTTSGGCPPINLLVNPPSGSTFPVGTTTVTAIATDGCGGNVQCSFLVHVLPPPPEYFYPQALLPPINSVYISPAQWHVLFNQGIIIRDVRHRFFTGHFPPPPLGVTQTHSFSSQVDFQVSFDNGNTFAPGSGTANVTVQVTHTQDVGGTQVFDTEMLQLDLIGSGFMLRESPTLQSKGQTTVRTVPGGYLIGSFFDVFTEVSTDNGATWTPAQQPGHVECHPDPKQVTPVPEPTTLLPPPNGTYISPQLWHALFAQGIVIRDVRHKLFTGALQPPPPGATNVHGFNSQLDLQVSTDGGNTYQYVRVAAPVQVTVASHGSSSDTMYDTEMTSLSFTLPNGVMIRESPTLPSRGQTELTSQGDGTYRIGSFFDIFPELSLDGGATWSPATNGPARMELTPLEAEVPKPNPNLPPLDGTYVSPQQWHALYANGIVLTNASHDRFTQTQPPPPPGGSQTENFGSRVRGRISMNGGASFSPFSASASVAVQVTSHSSFDTPSTRFFDTEMLSLSLSGGTLPAGVMIRESPSKASLGRTSVRDTGGGATYMIDSFFDVFTEVSLDGGQTWTPTVTHPGSMGLSTNPPPIVLTCSSNITTAATSPGGAVVTYTSSATGGCPPVNVVCNPPSGSTFPIGSTPVTCSASDACGNTVDCSFTVKVVKLIITINPVGVGGVQLSWPVGTLQEADSVLGPYIDVDPQPVSPYTFTPTPKQPRKFFRLRDGEPGFTFFDTELLQLDISGGNLPPGMRLRESPTLASTGKTAMSPNPGGGFTIDSFFDVFTELSLDNGASWMVSTGAPPHMRFVGTVPNNTLPPRDANYVSPNDWHALYAAGIYITNASHLGFLGSFPPPPPGGVTQVHSFGSTVQMQVSPCPVCPPQPVNAPANVTVKVTSRP